MSKGTKGIAIFVSFLMLTAFSTATFAAPKPKNFKAGAVYVLTNQVENAVAVFRRDAKGMLTSAGEFLSLVSSAAGTTGDESSPIDMALSNNSRFLYVHAGGSQAVVSFRVNKNGTLAMIDTDGGLPLGAQGIAAK